MRSITTRVVLAVLVVITAFALALGYSVTAQRELVARLARINQGYVPIGRALDDAHEELRSIGRALSQRDPVALRQSVRAAMTLFPFDQRVESHFDGLRAHLRGLLVQDLNPAERAFLSNIESVVAEMTVDVREQAVLAAALLDALDQVAPNPEPTLSQLGAQLLAFEKRLSDLQFVVDNRTDAAVAEVRTAERTILTRVVAVSGAAALFATVVVVLIARSLRPVRDLTSMASRFRRGDYGEVEVRVGSDEIGALAQEFVEMSAAIRDRDARLRHQNAELERAYAAVVVAQNGQVQAERLAAVGEMAARITHELRNPLSSIGLNAEMLADELREGSPSAAAREMLESIEHEVARLTELTDRYLSMARGDAPRREPADLVRVAADVVQRMRAELEAEGVVVELDAPRAALCSADDTQVRQVLINLLRNAVQAVRGRTDRRITVRVETGPPARVTVDDSGAGVASAVVATLFEPFTTTRADGTGLGLSISRRIARRHGGDLTLERSSPLGGARFVFTIGADGEPGACEAPL